METLARRGLDSKETDSRNKMEQVFFFFFKRMGKLDNVYKLRERMNLSSQPLIRLFR